MIERSDKNLERIFQAYVHLSPLTVMSFVRTSILRPLVGMRAHSRWALNWAYEGVRPGCVGSELM